MARSNSPCARNRLPRSTQAWGFLRSRAIARSRSAMAKSLWPVFSYASARAVSARLTFAADVATELMTIVQAVIARCGSGESQRTARGSVCPAAAPAQSTAKAASVRILPPDIVASEVGLFGLRDRIEIKIERIESAVLGADRIRDLDIIAAP